MWGWKFRHSIPSSILRIKPFLQVPYRVFNDTFRCISVFLPILFGDKQYNFICRVDKPFSVLLPLPFNCSKQRKKPCTAVTILFWEIRSCEKGLLVRRHQNCQRLSTLTGKCLTNTHINCVDIGALFSIHLNRNEIFIQNFCNLYVFK